MSDKLLKRVQYKYPGVDLSDYNYDVLDKLDQMTPTPKEYWEKECWEEISDNKTENNNEEN